MDRIKALLKKHRELLMYCIFGFATFLVDTGIYAILGTLFDLNNNDVLMHICSIFSTSLAIVFAYVTNRIFVFQSQTRGFRELAKEMASFFAARILTMVIAELLMQYTVGLLGLESRLMKVAVNIIVIILNYIFSKLWIFKKKDV